MLLGACISDASFSMDRGDQDTSKRHASSEPGILVGGSGQNRCCAFTGLHWSGYNRYGAVTTAVSQHVLLCSGAVTTAVCLQVPSLAHTGAVTTAFFCYRLLGSLVHLQFISNSKAQNTRTFWDTEFEKKRILQVSG